MQLLKKLTHKIAPDRRSFILAYHRIKDLQIDPWGMAVTPANFELQLKALAGRSGGEIDRSIFHSNPPRAYITFDDGYSDNFEYALPILKKWNVQATIFLATGYLGSRHEYWWDSLERIFLLPGRLPETLDLQVMGDSYRFPLKADAIYPKRAFIQHRFWRSWHSPPTIRHLLYNTFWSLLYRSERVYQEALIAGLEAWANCGCEPREHYLPMTVENVREMTSHGIHLGAHTVNHASVHHCSEDALKNEIAGSGRQVAEITGRDTSVFSYPYGETSSAAQTILSGSHFEVACTSATKVLSPQNQPLLAPRFSANNSSLKLIQSLLH